MYLRSAFVAGSSVARLSAFTLTRSLSTRTVNTLHSSVNVESKAASAPRALSLYSARYMSGNADAVEKQLRELADKFGEARMEIEDAKESAETIYFNEDTAAARELVKSLGTAECGKIDSHSIRLGFIVGEREVLDEYKRILDSLDGKARSSVQQSWGLKLEQLKGELQELENLHAEDH